MDRHTPEQRKHNMQAIKNSGSKIERKLQLELWHRGLRYRKNLKSVYGKPDIVFLRDKIAVFCDSEFFHGKDWEDLQEQLKRGNNAEFWIKKISQNRIRDEEINKQLKFMGWTVIRFWGKDIKKDVEQCVKVVEETIFEIMLNEKDLLD